MFSVFGRAGAVPVEAAPRDAGEELFSVHEFECSFKRDGLFVIEKEDRFVGTLLYPFEVFFSFAPLQEEFLIVFRQDERRLRFEVFAFGIVEFFLSVNKYHVGISGAVYVVNGNGRVAEGVSVGRFGE